MTQDLDDYLDDYDKYYHDEFDNKDTQDYNYYHYDKDTKINTNNYKDEIIDEIEEGEKYTARQLTIYAVNHPDVIIIHNNISNFDLSSNKTFKITQKFNGYIHFGKEGMYYHPCFQNVICIIE